MTEQKFVGRPLSKSYFEPCIWFITAVFILLTACLCIYCHTWGISSCCRSYFSGNKMIQNESQFDCVRKKDNGKKKNISTKLSKHLPLESYSQAVSIHLQLFVYHVRRCKYQLSTPPNLIFVLFL